MEKKRLAGLDRRRYWAALFVLISLGFIAGGVAFYRSEVNRIQQERYQELKAIGGLKAEQILQWRRESLADVEKTIRSPFFVKGVEDWFRDPRLLQALRERLKLEQTYNQYLDVLLASAEGRILVSSGDKPDLLERTERQAIERSIAGRSAILSDFHRSGSGKIYIDAMGPVFNGKGKLLALLILRSDAESALYPLIQSWPTPSSTAETLLVRRDGNDVLFLNNLRHRKDAALNLRYPLTDTGVPAVQAILGIQGIFHGYDYRDREVLADLRPVPESPWFMVAKVDTAEILVEARYRAGTISFFVLLFIVLTAVLTAYAYRHRQAFLYQALYRSERKERETQENFRTTLYSIGDAVITTDTQGAVKQMNRVAEALTGWKEAEVQGRPLREVFHIVNEETRQRVLNPVETVLQDGHVIALANDTLLIARDGAEHPVADSGAPICDDSGVVIGVVLVFRDQAEERRARKTLRESEIRFRELFDNLKSGIAVYRPTENGDDFILVDFNKGAEKTERISREAVIGRKVTEVFPGVKEFGLLDVFRRVWSTGVPEYHPIALYKDERISGWRENYVYRLPSEEVVAVYDDVTTERQAEEALRESEERYRVATEESNDGVAIMSADRHVYVNRRFLDIFGYDSLEEFGELPKYVNIHPDDREMVVQYNRRRQKGQDAPSRYEFRGLRKDGRTIYIEASVSGITYLGEPASLAYLRDITDRKQTEESLKSSLREKELLLREIHHRVKNNLTVIMSLLDLQARSAKDEKALSALRESADRIRTMAMIHTKLYQTESLAKINLREYLGDLADQVFASHGVDHSRVYLNLDVQDIAVDVDECIPLGLIVNELLSNALKHAFPSLGAGETAMGRKKEITIALKERTGEKSLENAGTRDYGLGAAILTVSDNGIGFPADKDFGNPDTLGLRLVSALAEQIDGTVDLVRGEGATFSITFGR
jgi:PAS domain S-box-containing protein